MSTMGLLQMDLGAHQQAERHLLEALRLDPAHALGLHLNASLMVRTGRLEKAEALLREALRLEPAFAEAHVAAGVPRGVLEAVLVPFMVFVLYTWPATPLAMARSRLRPPVR